MAVIINASTSTGLIQSADTSGIIQFQSNGSTKATLNSSGFSYPGGVLQVVSTIKTDTFTTTSGSYVDVTGLSVNITPTSASNKILVVVSVNYGGGTNSYGFAQLVRNGTPIGLGDSDGASRTECTFPLQTANTASDAAKLMNSSVTILDSPATTSAITYKVQALSGYTSTTLSINRSENNPNDTYSGLSSSTITVMEIAA
jgi:hypothetical protein